MQDSQFKNSLMTPLRTFIAMLAATILVACAATPQNEYAARTVPPLLDGKFLDTDLKTVDSSKIFYLDPSIRREIDKATSGLIEQKELTYAVAKLIFGNGERSMTYSNGANFVASDTYYQRSANCLSLTIMAFAMVEYSGLDGQFQTIEIPEIWTQRNGYSMLNRHINLVVSGSQTKSSFRSYFDDEQTVIDFDRSVGRHNYGKQTVTKNYVKAMFYNNLAAEHLASEEYDRAYLNLREALLISPDYADAWSNLGLFYRVHDEYEAAEQAYRYSLYLDGNDLNTLSNLAHLMSFKGNIEEANKIHRKVELMRLGNPFYHYLLGDEAYQRQEYQVAIKHYENAIQRDSSADEFYFGLAKAHLKLGHYEKAEYYLVKARKSADDGRQSALYYTKLDELRNFRLQAQ